MIRYYSFLFAGTCLLAFTHCRTQNTSQPTTEQSNSQAETPVQRPVPAATTAPAATSAKAADTEGILPGQYKIAEAFPALTFDQPVELISPPDGSNRIFVLAQKGKIHVFPNSPTTSASNVFLDLTSKVFSGGERGLLGIAFHPDYAQNGYFYLNYTRGNPLETAISRFRVSTSDPEKADPTSETVLLTYRQPFNNHNGGKIAFGPDGFLYISAGDGGSGGDPQNNAQDRSQLLGKIMRIDVNGTYGDLPYDIPEDNPFRGNREGFRQEIYAYGLRNVWRFSFDSQTGQLWAGDVGQNKIEEVNIIEKGANYGWRIMEASECFKASECDQQGLKMPVWEYVQGSETGRSITGGHVYRGNSLPGLQGKYVYGDFVTGIIWALTPNGTGQASKNELILDTDATISGFGVDAQEELYILSYNQGKILKLERND
jgi:glucose/arabinose dehydrogenase